MNIIFLLVLLNSYRVQTAGQSYKKVSFIYLTGDIFRRRLSSAEKIFGGDKVRRFSWKSGYFTYSDKGRRLFSAEIIFGAIWQKVPKFRYLSPPKYISSKVQRRMLGFADGDPGSRSVRHCVGLSDSNIWDGQGASMRWGVVAWWGRVGGHFTWVDI